MSDIVTRRRLVGGEDLAWMVIIGAVSVLVLLLLVSHLRVRFETWRIAEEKAVTFVKRREHEETIRRLLIQRQELRDRMDREALVRTVPGLGPVKPEQVVRMEGRP